MPKGLQPVVGVVFWRESATACLDERVHDPQAAEALPVLKIFAVENAALSFDGRRKNQGVIPRYFVPRAELQGLAEKGV